MFDRLIALNQGVLLIGYICLCKALKIFWPDSILIKVDGCLNFHNWVEFSIPQSIVL